MILKNGLVSIAALPEAGRLFILTLYLTDLKHSQCLNIIYLL
jgi:hypothetical protein